MIRKYLGAVALTAIAISSARNSIAECKRKEGATMPQFVGCTLVAALAGTGAVIMVNSMFDKN
jgi:hypothetical protein